MKPSHWHASTLRRPVLMALLALLALTFFGIGRVLADQTVSVKQSTLATSQGGAQMCPSGSTPTLWHFVITQIDNSSDVPPFITVTWDDGNTGNVTLLKFTGGTAHYEVSTDGTDPGNDFTAEAGHLVTNATATIYSGWSGEFNLSHVMCSGGSPGPAGSVVTTVVDTDTPDAPVSSAQPVGTSFHDEASIDSVPSGVAIPSGSSVTFKLYKGPFTAGCPDSLTPIKTFAPVSASGTTPAPATSPSTGALGPGDYAFVASFTSGDTSVLTSDDGICEPFSVNQGLDLTVTKTATPSFTRTFTWGISKSVDKTTIDIATGGTATFNYTVSVTHDSGTDSAWQVTGTITVTNPNTVEDITGVSVTDAIDDGGTCSVTSGTNLTVSAGKSVTLDYTCTYATAPGPSSFTNTATATWDKTAAFTPDGTATGTAIGDFSKISPTKIVDGTVSVTDTFGGTLGTVSYTDPSPKQFTYSHAFSGDPAGTCTKHDNTATFTTNTSGTTGSASQTVQVCVGTDLTVSKTATPAFTRTYTWGITKSDDCKPVVELAGGSITCNYTVKVTHDGGTDGGWAVTGTITVTNPNDWEAITADVSDSIDNGGSCTVTGGTGVSVPASGHKDLSYTCTYTSAPSPSAFKNTGKASWDSSTFFTPDGSATGIATGDFSTVTPTIVDGSVAVTDTLAPNPPLPATVTYSDASPKTFTYALTFKAPAGGTCADHPNTATVKTNTTGTTGSANADVEVCNTQTGALTMGFWQNKNGQGIITSYCGGASTTSLNTFLTQYNPFKDLTSSKCSDIAAYVSTIIKNATASGAAMNAMLKAQMLATALDVYFSDPALGGNKISAANPIGGVKIDLVHGCPMIDTSGGTGTCSGSENWSPAFNNLPSMTVSDMLKWAASQASAATAANPLASPWYGQVKATQQLAKDAFDAINNQAANIAP